MSLDGGDVYEVVRDCEDPALTAAEIADMLDCEHCNLDKCLEDLEDAGAIFKKETEEYTLVWSAPTRSVI